MPDGHDPLQFVAEQLNFPVAQSGESVRSNAADVTATNSNSANNAVDDKGIFILYRLTVNVRDFRAFWLSRAHLFISCIFVSLVYFLICSELSKLVNNSASV